MKEILKKSDSWNEETNFDVYVMYWISVCDCTSEGKYPYMCLYS